MKGPDTLKQYEDNWQTSMGAWFPEKRAVLRGKDIFTELGDQRWMAVFLLGITGREFNDKQVDLFEGIWVLVTSYSDPRIWPNRVAALAGTTRSTGILAMSSAFAAFEAEILGGRATLRAAEFLVRMKRELAQGKNLKTLVKKELRRHRAIPGYGRPISASDERLEPVMKLAKKLGYDQGEYVKLALEIQQCLAKLYPLQITINMTIAAILTALSLDQKLNPREIYNVFSICAAVGMKTCYIDASEKPEGLLFPLQCSRINYTGKPVRTWE